MIRCKEPMFLTVLISILLQVSPVYAQSEFSNLHIQEIDPRAPEVCKFNDGLVSQYSVEYDQNDSILSVHLQFVYVYDSIGNLIALKSGFEPAMASIDGQPDNANVFEWQYEDTVLAYNCTTQNYVYNQGRLQKIEFEMPVSFFRFNRASGNKHFSGEYNIKAVYNGLDQLLSKEVFYQKRLMYTVRYIYNDADAPGRQPLQKVIRKSSNGNYMITYIQYQDTTFK